MVKSQQQWYALPDEQALGALTAKKEGLEQQDAVSRLKTYGFNEVKEVKQDTILKILLRQFKSFVLWVLMSAAIISSIVGHDV